MPRLVLFPCLWWFLTGAAAQQPPGRLTGKLVDPGQYDDIKNSPYLFDTFVPATLVPLTGEPITDVKVNFNGHTQVFELEKDGLRVEMEIGLLMGVQVLVPDSSCGLPTFLKLLHPKLVNKYPLFLYQGRTRKLLKDFRVALVEHKGESHGKTVRVKTFNSIKDYFLMTGNDLQPIRLSREDIFRRFPDPALREFVDARRLDLSTECGVCAVLAWLENEELRIKN